MNLIGHAVTLGHRQVAARGQGRSLSDVKLLPYEQILQKLTIAVVFQT